MMIRRLMMSLTPSSPLGPLSRNRYAFRTEPSTDVHLNLRPHRIGIFVDFENGQVQYGKSSLHIFCLPSAQNMTNIQTSFVTRCGFPITPCPRGFCRCLSTTSMLKSTSTLSMTRSVNASTRSSAPALINLERTTGR